MVAPANHQHLLESWRSKVHEAHILHSSAVKRYQQVSGEYKAGLLADSALQQAQDELSFVLQQYLSLIKLFTDLVIKTQSLPRFSANECEFRSHQLDSPNPIANSAENRAVPLSRAAFKPENAEIRASESLKLLKLKGTLPKLWLKIIQNNSRKFPTPDAQI
jgi:hypothetical protein